LPPGLKPAHVKIQWLFATISMSVSTSVFDGERAVQQSLVGTQTGRIAAELASCVSAAYAGDARLNQPVRIAPAWLSECALRRWNGLQALHKTANTLTAWSGLHEQFHALSAPELDVENAAGLVVVPHPLTILQYPLSSAAVPLNR